MLYLQKSILPAQLCVSYDDFCCFVSFCSHKDQTSFKDVINTIKARDFIWSFTTLTLRLLCWKQIFLCLFELSVMLLTKLLSYQGTSEHISFCLVISIASTNIFGANSISLSIEDSCSSHGNPNLTHTQPSKRTWTVGAQFSLLSTEYLSSYIMTHSWFMYSF